MKLISTNPGKNYTVIGEVEMSSSEDIRNAVAKAREAQLAWRALSVAQRIQHLRSFIVSAEKRKEDITRMMSLETGRPIATSYHNFERGIIYLQEYFTYAEKTLAPTVVYEDEKSIHTVYREPWGVLACISPWNFPFLNIAWQCGQPLLAGNTVVYKNSEENPLFCKIIEEVVKDSSLPDSVFTVLYGDGKVGDQLAHAEVDMILFTGSTKTGQHLLKAAAEKFIPIHLELGGSSAGIVFEDAQDDDLIQSIFNARFDNSGQYCDGLKRLLVHQSRFDDVVKKLAIMCETTKVGEQFEKETMLGPLVAKRQLELLEDQVADAKAKGAKVVAGGNRPVGLEGAYYLPTILTHITHDMRVWKEEVFGPVLPVLPFSTEEEAVALANDTIYGLTAYVYTSSKERYHRVAGQLQAGVIIPPSGNAFSPRTPFGGYKKSGMGRQNGMIGFEDVTQIKVIGEEK